MAGLTLLHNRLFFEPSFRLQFVNAPRLLWEQVMTEVAVTKGILMSVVGEGHIPGTSALEHHGGGPLVFNGEGNAHTEQCTQYQSQYKLYFHVIAP